MAPSFLSIALTIISLSATFVNASPTPSVTQESTEAGKPLKQYGSNTTVPAEYLRENRGKEDNIVGGPLPLPFPVSDFTETAVSIQNVYCDPAFNQIGTRIGDQTILYTIGDDSTTLRANIYLSDSLGLVLAYMGTNGSSIISTLPNDDLLLELPDPALDLPPLALTVNGMQWSWLDTWPAVKASLHDAQQRYPNLQVLVTGHSQGASTALLAALAIRKEFGSEFISKIITYGPPRTGNFLFADTFDSYFKGRYTGVTNGNDWVSELPPPIYASHPSGMVWINPANSTNWGFYPDQEDLNGIDSRVPEFISPTGQEYWGDHEGFYMHSRLGGIMQDGGIEGPCPAIVGGF